MNRLRMQLAIISMADCLATIVIVGSLSIPVALRFAYGIGFHDLIGVVAVGLVVNLGLLAMIRLDNLRISLCCKYADKRNCSACPHRLTATIFTQSGEPNINCQVMLDLYNGVDISKSDYSPYKEDCRPKP